MKETQAPEVQNGQTIWRTIKPKLPERMLIRDTCLSTDETGNMLELGLSSYLRSYVHKFGKDWHLDKQIARTRALVLCQAKARNLRKQLRIIESTIDTLRPQE